MEILSFKGGKDRNLSYLVYNKKTKESLIVDPFKNIDIYLKKALSLKLKIKGFVNTHSHGDHTEGNEDLEKIGIKKIKNKRTITLGKQKIKIISVPGHSEDSVCFYFQDKLITGDVLLVNRVGMTKNRENSKKLFNSLKKLIKLNKNTKVYPGHYYNSKFPTTIKKELENNPYLKCKNLKEFEELMDKWRIHTIKYHLKTYKHKK